MSDEREERIRTLDELRKRGVDPFGKRFDGAQPIGPIVAGFSPETEGKEFTVAGRITALRGHGKAAFLDLRDWTGKVQLYVKKDTIGEDAFGVFQNLGIGDWMGATGTLGKTRTGEISLFATRVTLLTKSLRPLPEKWHGLKDPEIRYRQRYVDLIANPPVLETFLKRSRILTRLRELLSARGYVEVETPVMTAHAGGAAARPFLTHHNALGMDLFLRIALEIPLKKLLVGGIERVYEIGRVFRNEGVDSSHNPEFTLLELYHAFGDLRTMMELVESLVSQLASEVCGTTDIPWGERTLKVAAPWPRKDYFELLAEHAGVNPDDEGALRRKLKEKGQDVAALSKVELLDGVFGEFVEPHLQDAVFVTGQPIEMTPLCREMADRPGRADRFESYLGGMELTNAYTELNDPLEQRRRLEAQAKGDASKIDEDFLAALEHGMPPAGGLGLGVDRLVRILTNQRSIREIIFFPLMREVSNLSEAAKPE